MSVMLLCQGDLVGVYPITLHDSNGDLLTQLTVEDLEYLHGRVNQLIEKVTEKKHLAWMKDKGYVQARLIQPDTNPYLMNETFWVKPDTDHQIWHFICGSYKGTMHKSKFEVISGTTT